MVSYSRVDCHIRSQVSEQKQEREIEWKQHKSSHLIRFLKRKNYLLVDEPGDAFKLKQLLVPSLRPHVVRWDVSRPVGPVPGSSGGKVLQQVFDRLQRQIALAIGSPVASLPVPPAGNARVFTATQRLFAVCGAANYILLSGVTVIHKQTGD